MEPEKRLVEMTDLSASRELVRLRLTPLNRAASLKLREAGAFEREGVLPVFLLMEWGLTEGIRLTHCRTAKELLRLSLLADRQSAVDYLLTNYPGGAKELTRRLLRMKPRAAAQLLLDVLDMRLKADPRNPYPAE
jgi:hypothetical protein